MQSLEGLFNEKKVCIFGTGSSGESAFDILDSIGVNVDFFIDNNKEKWGKFFFGKPIHSPEFLSSENNNAIHYRRINII